MRFQKIIESDASRLERLLHENGIASHVHVFWGRRPFILVT